MDANMPVRNEIEPASERISALQHTISGLLSLAESSILGVSCHYRVPDLGVSIGSEHSSEEAKRTERFRIDCGGGTLTVFAEAQLPGNATVLLQSVAESAAALVENFRELPPRLDASQFLRFAPGVLGLISRDGRILEPGQVLLGDLRHPDDGSAALLSRLMTAEDWARLAERPKFPAAIEARLQDAEGLWSPYILFFRELPFDQGYLVTAQPGSILSRAEGENQYRDLFEHATDMLYTHDLSGNITLFNQTAERLTGCPRQLALTKNIRDLVAPDHHGVITQALERLLGGEPITKYRVEILTPSGKHCPVEVSSRLMFDSGRPAGVQSAGRDLRERQRLETQLLHAHKMEAIGRLAGGVAHDFNNLLTVIGGYTQWILDELGPEHPLWDAAHESMLATDRARRLTNQLLAFSRMQMVRLENVDLNTVVARIERMLRRVIGEDVELQISMTPQLWQVRADAGQVEQILLNLCVNSRDAMPNGGTIRIETANVHVSTETPAAVEIPPGDYAVFRVADNGCGMDEETRTRAFEPFFTTKDIGKGTGLGLSTVYGIVRQSNGHIRVESGLGEGTSISVYLPRETVPFPDDSADTTVYPAKGNETILLVEDETAVRRMVREMLVRLGYSVIEAADGKIAYEMLQGRDRHIDVLLTDVVMPEMGGRELAEVARVIYPGLRVLYISGYTPDALLSDRALLPGVALLNKPFTPQVLARKIREILDSPLSV